MEKKNALAIVLPLVPLSVCAYQLLQEKKSVVPWNYDVFLSFRGPDTRTGFTDFLYNSLVAAGFHVFRDNDCIRVGKKIGPELLGAIRNCRIAIPIISKQYAQSKWCLRELTEIMDCHRNHGKSVFPVFYKEDPVDVHLQRVNFEKALYKPEKQIRAEDVEKWWNALTSVTRIKGWISQTIANGHEAELVKKVVEKVSTHLKTRWIERLPMFISSVHLPFSEKKRRESKCPVFLAFRGPDTRHGLAAFLSISLVAAGIKVFEDDDPSLIGKLVDQEICTAIYNCKISIPILSEDYASSHYCLNELVRMVECKRTKGQQILPIFYKVRNSHVRDLSGVFGEKILKHERLVDECTYEQWKRALKEVGSFKGWESDRIADGHEGVLVKKVVKEVLRLLKDPLTNDPPPLSAEHELNPRVSTNSLVESVFPVLQEEFPGRSSVHW